MQPLLLTLLADAAAHTLPARGNGTSILVAPSDLARATDWRLEPAGLCCDCVCLPASGRPDLVVDGDVDLVALAVLLDHPLALDVEHAAAVLGAQASARAADVLAPMDWTIRPRLDAVPRRPPLRIGRLRRRGRVGGSRAARLRE